MPRINEMPRNNYISPVIEKLREYDKKHSTDFLDTLKVYIRNLCSTSDSAAQLHIHRNSFLYRINKIEEITGVDLREYHTFIHLADQYLHRGDIEKNIRPIFHRGDRHRI